MSAPPSFFDQVQPEEKSFFDDVHPSAGAALKAGVVSGARNIQQQAHMLFPPAIGSVPEPASRAEPPGLDIGRSLAYGAGKLIPQGAELAASGFLPIVGPIATAGLQGAADLPDEASFNDKLEAFKNNAAFMALAGPFKGLIHKLPEAASRFGMPYVKAITDRFPSWIGSALGFGGLGAAYTAAQGGTAAQITTGAGLGAVGGALAGAERAPEQGAKSAVIPPQQ